MPSREPELYKDKIEVSLDGRQIFYLFFGGAVIVGLVFVIGVMVGRRVESRGHLDRADTQTVRDPLAALDQLERSDHLSFRRALTGGDTASDVEKAIGELEKRRAAGKADRKEPEAKPDKPEAKLDKPEGKPDKPDRPGKADKADLRPEQAAQADKPDSRPERAVQADKPDRAAQADKPDRAAQADKPDKADKPSKPSKGDKPDRSEKHDAKVESSGRSDTDMPRADKPDKADKPDRHDGERKPKKHDDAEARADKPVTRPDARAEGKSEDAKVRFTLQLSSFQDRAEAEAFLSTMRSAGFQAYLTEADVGGKGTFYRVRLGSYRSLEAANDAKAEYEKSARKTAQVMRL